MGENTHGEWNGARRMWYESSNLMSEAVDAQGVEVKGKVFDDE